MAKRKKEAEEAANGKEPALPGAFPASFAAWANTNVCPLVAVEVGWELAGLWETLSAAHVQPDSRDFVLFLADAARAFQEAHASPDPMYWYNREDYMDCLLAWTDEVRRHVRKTKNLTLPKCVRRPEEVYP